jgi:hypothetical protein
MMRARIRKAAAMALMLVVAGCAAVTQSSSPSVSPSSAPSLSPSAVAHPSSPPLVQPSGTPDSTPSSNPTAVLTIPDAAIRSLSLGSPLAIRGSRVFVQEGPSGGGAASGARTLRMGDLATGKTVTLVTLNAGHEIAALTVTADRVLWVETWRTGVTGDCNGAVPCCPGQGHPLNWRVVGLVVTSGARSVIASGTNTRTAYQGECADVNPPALAADADRVAYTLEATAQGAPFGNRIVVRSLANGSVIRSVTTTGFVAWLGLSGPALVYREALGTELDGTSVQDAQLMLATADGRTPELVDVHAISAAVSGDRLVWGRTDSTDASIWTMSLSTALRAHVAGPAVPDFKAQGETGSSWVSLTDGYAAWVTSGTLKGGDQSAIPFLWNVGQPNARLVALPSAVDFVSVSDGWLIWHDASQAIVHGVQLSDLVN